MDKYELVLDIIERPDRYTLEQLAEIMSDPETREIYNLLCKTNSAIDAGKNVDVDAEWEKFSNKYAVHHSRSFFGLGNRAASIVAITATSIIAVAAGIAVTVAIIDHKPELMADECTVSQGVEVVTTDAINTRIDSVYVVLCPVVFENEPLEKIMKGIACAYGVEVKFNNRDAALLHLYYKLDPTLPLNEVVEQLNTFEQINIKQNGNILIID